MAGNAARHGCSSRKRVNSGTKPTAASLNVAKAKRRQIFVHAGKVVIRAVLLDTPTADRIWRTLPIYSTAEIWGEAVHFETHADTGRERGAKWNVSPGEIAFWSEQDRVIIGYGMTPLSRPGEIRLPSPCNVWAIALDDVGQLAAVRPGQKIAILEAAS